MRQKFRFDKDSGTMGPDIPVPQNPPEMKKVEIPEAESKSLIGDSKVSSNIPVSEGIVQFREQSDLTIFQILDEQSGVPLGYISGYALDINFNMRELRSAERVEQFLDGIKKMFREAILDKAFSAKK